MIRVYFNLHLKKLSIQEYRKGWRLKEHLDSIILKDAIPKVYESERQRVLRDRRKNVHAFLVGIPCESTQGEGVEITYNPYKYKTFVRKSDEAEFVFAKFLRIEGRKVLAYDAIFNLTNSVKGL